jgi:hypothetical protein
MKSINLRMILDQPEFGIISNIRRCETERSESEAIQILLPAIGRLFSGSTMFKIIFKNFFILFL